MDQVPLILIGSAPSSGSTMVADLFDSSPFTACGPELELMCNRQLYDYPAFKVNPNAKSELFSLRATSIFPRYERLHHYGMERADLQRMLNRSPGLNTYFASFSRKFLKYRGKPETGLVFEKTPQNTNVIDLYTQDDRRHFIVLVRHPMYVMNSLLNRGWHLYTAACTWLLYTAKMWEHMDKPNVKVIKLEELVKDPFTIASAVINDLNGRKKVSPEALQDGFEHNTYRREASQKLDSWSVQSGDVPKIVDPNSREVSEERRALFQTVLRLKVSATYATRFGVAEISMLEAMDRFGYDYQLPIDEPILREVLSPVEKERLRFARKVGRSKLEGHGKWSDFFVYSNAVKISR